MAGHSKWANIKHKKAREDSKRGKIFTRIIKEMTISARDGGGDTGTNSKLRLLVEKARAANMPQDNIIRAIKRGTGELEGVNYEEISYEGYAPGGVAVFVETLTDNNKRTVADVRHVFTKLGGNLADSGSVSWMFERKGVVTIASDNCTEDDVLEKLIEYDIEDVVLHEDLITVYCGMQDLEKVKNGAEKVGLKVEDAEIEMVPKDPMTIENKEKEEKIYKFLAALEEIDDVQNVYANIA
jgi:YebC/PmpR family DNA-binding regulatory protein